MNKPKPDPVVTNQSDKILAAKQNKGVFQQSIIHNSMQRANNTSNLNTSQVIQIYDEKTEHEDKSSGKIMKYVPWMLLGIIGLWTFVFMISDIVDYNSWKFITQNSLTNIASWYSSDTSMQTAALGYNGGIGRNYISFIDFIFYYYITKFFFNIWLTNDYFAAGAVKNYFTIFLLLKDCTVIILALAGGNWDSFSGWSGFGYFWLNTFGKLSILLSLQKIFFFRLNYFRMFSEVKDGCSGTFLNWGTSLYTWASQNNRNPEFTLTLLLFGIYLPLVLHCIVGLIESTYILIIWVAILFFLQQFISFLFELCKPRTEEKPLVQRLLERQRSGISEQINKFWIYYTLLYVIIPGVASVSFGANFKNAMKYHFNGQQLMFNFYSFPPSGADFSNSITFICNLLSLI